MPDLAPRVCRKFGCKRLTRDRKTGLCSVHRAEERKSYDKRRGSAAARGYDARWRKVRAAKLRANPMCERSGCRQVAVLVHHIDENPRNNAESNLMSLCNGCHEEIHGKARFRGSGSSLEG